MNTNPIAPPLWKWFSVCTSNGLRVSVYARNASEAKGRVHLAVAAWPGIEPLGPAANDNARARS